MRTPTVVRNGLIALTLLSLPVSAAGLALADSGRGVEHSQFAEHKGPGKAGRALGDLTRMEAENMAVQAMAEISGQSEAAVRAKIEEEGFREAAKSYGIDREDMMQAMRPRVEALVRQARDSGRITAQQADTLLARLQEGPPEGPGPGKGEQGDKQHGEREHGDRKYGDGEHGRDGRHERGGPLGELARMEVTNMLSDTVAELSGKPVEEVQAQFEAQGIRETVKSYDLDRTALRDGVKARMKEAVTQAQQDGRITAEQAAKLMERLDNAKGGRDG